MYGIIVLGYKDRVYLGLAARAGLAAIASINPKHLDCKPRRRQPYHVLPPRVNVPSVWPEGTSNVVGVSR